MRILIVSDEECPALWDYYVPGRLKEYDLILSCGDLKSEYLSFLVTMASCPVLYVQGNHDEHYLRKPPEGCDCIDDAYVEYNGVRILGLGGCRRYHPGPFQYTESQMRRRIRRMFWPLRRHGSVDILLTHSPARDLGDADDPAHWGFEALRAFLDKYRPRYLLHGHVHRSYGVQPSRIIEYGDTTIINACERYVLDIPDRDVPAKKAGRIIWLKRPPKSDMTV